MEKAMRKGVWALGCVLALCAGVALAAEQRPVREQVENSMLVTGAIDIQPDGTVAGHALDEPEKLPSGIVQLLAQATPHWRFEPVRVEGKPVFARTKMSVRIVAKRQGDGGYEVRVASARFGEPRSEDWPSHDGPLGRPRFPKEAAQAGVGGTVYVMLKIGRDGKVVDLVAEQINLKTVVSEAEMEMWRHVLARAALQRASQWTFVPPTQGAEVDAPFWSIRVPVDFVAGGSRPAYGRWETYIPGSRTPAPWVDAEEARMGADAVALDGFQPIGGGPRLLSSLDPGS
ncbi:energy transducer TonB [Lysobacter sp. LF1]|uniref:Energy transducer TonB n=1 Tax=Lysobacter stagni TaxID=3045172 RepID=A0ABT6XDW1_9GAMM|nr:energy transducer TonB [Lysobacter sp. LF1]MDI9238329.1 energy transducer TonB [Lysobacter sp. LF1]